MQILLDNQLNGMDRFLKILGFEVITAFELGFTKETDETVIQYAKKHDMVLVTEDNKAAKLSELLEVETIHLDMKMKANVVADEIRKRFDTRFKTAE
jgi:predicted nuclease of predicted toxin-antitoxin system